MLLLSSRQDVSSHPESVKIRPLVSSVGLFEGAPSCQPSYTMKTGQVAMGKIGPQTFFMGIFENLTHVRCWSPGFSALGIPDRCVIWILSQNIQFLGKEHLCRDGVLP